MSYIEHQSFERSWTKSKKKKLSNCYSLEPQVYRFEDQDYMYVFFILGKVMQNCKIYLMSCERIYILDSAIDAICHIILLIWNMTYDSLFDMSALIICHALCTRVTTFSIFGLIWFVFIIVVQPLCLIDWIYKSSQTKHSSSQLQSAFRSIKCRWWVLY